jgi:hypothetical protein
MNVFDIFEQQELDQLPLDHQLAFLSWAKRAREVLDQRTSRYSDQDENGWRLINSERHSFVNLLVAIGKRYGIEPFTDYSVPTLSDFGDNAYGDFSTELDHYAAQIVVDDTIRRSRQGVELPSASKDKIRDYIHQLRELIDKASLNDAKKAQLHARLSEFEDALGKRRFTIIELSLIAIAFASAPGGFDQSIGLVNRLIGQITTVVAEAKVTEDETRSLPVIPQMPALSPPQPKFKGPSPRRSPAPSAPPFESGGMDDDIPF